MKTEDISLAIPSIWKPLTQQVELAVLGKLGEELGELVSAICRAIIQGGLHHEHTDDPEDTNRDRIREEIADVQALCWILCDLYDMDEGAIQYRRDAKIRMKRKWINALEAHLVMKGGIDPQSTEMQALVFKGVDEDIAPEITLDSLYKKLPTNDN